MRSTKFWGTGRENVPGWAGSGGGGTDVNHGHLNGNRPATTTVLPGMWFAKGRPGRLKYNARKRKGGKGMGERPSPPRNNQTTPNTTGEEGIFIPRGGGASRLKKNEINGPGRFANGVKGK